MHLLLSVLLTVVPVRNDTSKFVQARQLLQSVLAHADDSGSYHYLRTRRQFAHLSRPWQTRDRDLPGYFTLLGHGHGLFVADTAVIRKKAARSYSYALDTNYFTIDYGDTALSNVSVEDREDFVESSVIFSPVLMLRRALALLEPDFIGMRQEEQNGIRRAELRYRRPNAERLVISIDLATNTVFSLTRISPDPMLGDVEQQTIYVHYSTTPNGGQFPTLIEEVSHKTVLNQVAVFFDGSAPDTSTILSRVNAKYRLAPPFPEPVSAPLTVEKVKDHIYLIDVPAAQSRSLLVEFKKFLLIAEAPLSTANGDSLIAKAHQLFPGKPIKYFVHGHHHNWYLGGVRAFIHEDATLLAQPQDTAYIRELASFPHTLRPDILSGDPNHAVHFETYDSIKVISDGETEMRILKIGALSHHTDDYAIYYVPNSKLLFEDDLMAFTKDSVIRSASNRQRGLYEGIQHYDLNVETILQNWPSDMLTEVPFAMLKKSVEMK